MVDVYYPYRLAATHASIIARSGVAPESRLGILAIMTNFSTKSGAARAAPTAPPLTALS